eukprot:TRINITY_DN132_c0_g1_i15.p2 TRINITY_DN132_c0_g1~~TRINITY_DN132_c0_g1_i15.p2  ORF type:complete len:159 (+),score=24.48 TRINITY_DN132_c0_g1_i15:483-959(+)
MGSQGVHECLEVEGRRPDDAEPVGLELEGAHPWEGRRVCAGEEPCKHPRHLHARLPQQRCNTRHSPVSRSPATTHSSGCCDFGGWGRGSGRSSCGGGGSGGGRGGGWGEGRDEGWDGGLLTEELLSQWRCGPPPYSALIPLLPLASIWGDTQPPRTLR